MAKSVREDVFLDGEGLSPVSMMEIGIHSALNRKLRNIVERPYKGDDDYKEPIIIEKVIDQAIKKG